jgi:hypothetical protein
LLRRFVLVLVLVLVRCWPALLVQGGCHDES